MLRSCRSGNMSYFAYAKIPLGQQVRYLRESVCTEIVSQSCMRNWPKCCGQHEIDCSCFSVQPIAIFEVIKISKSNIRTPVILIGFFARFIVFRCICIWR